MQGNKIELLSIRWCAPPAWRTPPPTTVRDRRPVRRIYIFVLVLLSGAALIWAGHDVHTVLFTLFGVGLAGAMIARWVVDGVPLPTRGSALGSAGAVEGAA